MQSMSTRSLLAGCLVGAVLCATSLYSSLKVGISGGGSLMAAALAYALFAKARPLSAHETNMSQTVASGAGTMASAAGLTAAIPALQLLDHEYSAGQLLVWAFAVCGFGACLAAALRGQMLSDVTLPFPTGAATASTIESMCSVGSAGRNMTLLVRAALLAAALVVIAQVPTVARWVAGVEAWPWFVGVPAAYLLAMLFSPMNVGIGGLVGVRIGASLLLGAVLAWGVLGRYVVQHEWVEAGQLRGWLLWPGVALLLGESLTKVGFMVPSFRRALSSGLGAADVTSTGPEDTQIPKLWWVGGLVASAVCTALAALWLFEVPLHLTALAFLLSSVLAVPAMRATGETDVAPSGPLAKTTQLLYGVLAPHQAATNVAAAAVTVAGSAQACDLMHDLKTGQILGTPPRQQFLAQLLGSLSGAALCVPMYLLLTRGLTIGSTELPAPGATSWAAVAEVATRGVAGLPPHADVAIAVGLVVGAALALGSRRKTLRDYLPSGMALGIAFLLPAPVSVAIFAGACLFAWRSKKGASVEANGTVAAGLITGEACAGVAVAGVLALGRWLGFGG